MNGTNFLSRESKFSTIEIFKQRLEIYEIEKHGFKHQKADVMRLYLISPLIQRVYYL